MLEAIYFLRFVTELQIGESRSLYTLPLVNKSKMKHLTSLLTQTNKSEMKHRSAMSRQTSHTFCGLLKVYKAMFDLRFVTKGVLDVIHTFPLVLLSFKSEICLSDVRS